MHGDAVPVGLGLDRGRVELTVARADWAPFARSLASAALEAAGDAAVAVEFVGSASVPGLRCKPIVDLALGLHRAADVGALTSRLEAIGWIFRGDAGDEGGLVFVRESRPLHRIAHLHAVDHGGRQWRNYVAFRDLLRRDEAARATYERTKLELRDRFPHNRVAYTAGKHDTVEALLAAAGGNDT